MAEPNLNSLVLSIGDISVLVFSKNQEFMAQTEARYANFISTKTAPLLRIEVNILSEKMVPNLATDIERPEVMFDHGTEQGGLLLGKIFQGNLIW